jgi:FixJ family two-component response regulator
MLTVEADVHTIDIRAEHASVNDFNNLRASLAPYSAPSRPPTVYLVSADATLPPVLLPLLAPRDCVSKTFSSAEALLDALDDDGPACLIIDTDLPGLASLAFQEILRRRAPCIPLVFLAANADIALVVRAMRAGAIDFLSKPLTADTLDEAVARALHIATELREADLQRRMGRERLAMLTRRERQVLEHVLAGRRNKQIASALVSEEATVKVHRSRLMRKLGVRSLPELLSLALPVIAPDGR